MRARAIVVLLLGLGLAGGSVALTHRYMRSQPGEAQAALPPVPLADIVVARADIPFGHDVLAEQLRLQPWPKEAVPAGAFASMEAVLGEGGAEPRRARRAIAAGEPLLESKVSGFGEKVTIADIIDPKKRAVAIRVNDVTGVAGFVTPGDRVDVILTRELDDGEMRADTILQSVLVRGVDQVADEDKDKPSVVRTVTVEVGPEEAQKLTLAQQAGTLSLLLRSLGAEQVAAVPSMRTKDLVPEEAGPARPLRPEVSVVRGGARSTVEVVR